MKIGLDFDGVIADCGRLKSEVALELYNAHIPPENFKKELVVGGGLLTLEQYRELQDKIYATREHGLKMMPVPEVFSYLPSLVKRHEVSVVTSRGEAETLIAQEWLNSQNPDVEVEFISVGYGNSKALVVEGFDIFVDDDLDKLEPLVGLVPHLFLFSWGYNKHVSEDGIAQRVDSWALLNRRIVEMSEKEIR